MVKKSNSRLINGSHIAQYNSKDNPLDMFLRWHSYSRYMLCKKLGLSRSGFQYVARKRIELWTIKYIFQLANALDMDISNVLKELLKAQQLIDEKENTGNSELYPANGTYQDIENKINIEDEDSKNKDQKR